MPLITQESRISHHTLYGSASATFSIPPSEDFTDGSWNINGTELALSEIGVNEDAGLAYIRIGSDIKQFQLYGSTSSANTLFDTLVAGNTTGPNFIDVDSGYGLQAIDTINNITDTIILDPEVLSNGTGIFSTDGTDIGQVIVNKTSVGLEANDGSGLCRC